MRSLRFRQCPPVSVSLWKVIKNGLALYIKDSATHSMFRSVIVVVGVVAVSQVASQY